jgi:hypothetical protein
MTQWKRLICGAALAGLCCCNNEASSTADGGSTDGGTCFSSQECPCTCTCPSGAQRTTQADCIKGFCVSCGSWCVGECG